MKKNSPGCVCCGDAICGETIDWDFTDSGFIDGGQDGALRSYGEPGDVTASPWSYVAGGLRCDFEDSDDDPISLTHPIGLPTTGPGCADHNAYIQTATASTSFTIASNKTLTIEFNGVGEQQDTGFENMTIAVDSVAVGTATSPGGNLGCTGMADVVPSPTPPITVALAAGLHTIDIACTTTDRFYHVGAYYQFRLSCVDA